MDASSDEIFGSYTHLRRALSAYATYYNTIRTHLALRKDAPLGRCTQRAGTITRVPHVGGLHHAVVRNE